MMKVGGQWVSPVEVENAVIAHPAGLETAVVGDFDSDELVKPKAYVVLKVGYEPSDALAEELKVYVMWNLENSHITCIMWTTSAFLLKSFQRMAGVFHIINAQRRLADWHFERAQTWEDLLAAHEKWLLDFNYQHHFAHEQRQDGCHTPASIVV